MISRLINILSDEAKEVLSSLKTNSLNYLVVRSDRAYDCALILQSPLGWWFCDYQFSSCVMQELLDYNCMTLSRVEREELSDYVGMEFDSVISYVCVDATVEGLQVVEALRDYY